ncbi:MAG TPA: DUF58 domain-containing protein [Marmoricola sp.]
MREALRSLTARGRGFLAAGVTAAVCGFLLGERDLVGIGVLAAAVPLATAAWVSLSRHDLSVARTLSAPQVEVGASVTVRVEIENRAARTPRLLFEDHVPYALGARPRAAIEPLGAGDHAGFEYTLRSDVRGSYPVGPAHVRIAEPFGMLALRRSFHTVEHLVVTPRVEPLPAIALAGAQVGAGDQRPRAFAGGNATDVTVREYRLGDDRRRVHWRSTAHTGTLMVRRDERPRQTRCTLLIDNRERAHRGRGAGSSLESAVRTGASIAIHLAGLGYQVRMVTATGEDLGHGWHDGGAMLNTRSLLAGLAMLPAEPSSTLATDWIDETVSSSLFLAVLGAVDEADHPFFSRVGRVGGAKYGVVLDVDAWAARDRSESPTTPITPWLQAIGWRATEIGPTTQLASAWQELGR